MSGRPCSACADPRRPELDAAIVRGDSLRDIAGQCPGISKSALSRHRPHVGTALIRAAERKGERFDESLLEKVERLEDDARRLGERAEREGDLRAALVAVDKLLDVTKLLHELMPVEGSDARTLAEHLARAKAEKLTITVLDRDVQLELLREAREREAAPSLKALPPSKG